MNAKIEISRDAIAAFCQRNHIRRMAFFGSVLRDDFGPESDVDVLVEFEPGTSIGYMGLMRLEIELGEVLGRKTDLHTFKGIEDNPNWLLREEILNRQRNYMSKRDDRVSLVDMLIHAREAVELEKRSN